MIITLNMAQKMRLIQDQVVTPDIFSEGLSYEDKEWDEIMANNYDWHVFTSRSTCTVKLRNKRDHSKQYTVKVPMNDSLSRYFEETKSQCSVYTKKKK